MEKETEWKLHSECDNRQRINEMQLTLDRERETSQRMTRELAQLREELEEQKKLNREEAKDNLVALAKAKDQIGEQSSAELDSIRQKVQQEIQVETDRLQSQLRTTERELSDLRAENQRLRDKERDNLHTLDHTEKTVIAQLNEECRRSASVLGGTPRQVSLSVVSDSTNGQSQIIDALANLRAVNEELRKRILELTSQLDNCRARISTVLKDKEDSLENMRLEMEKKRTLEMENIKEKLIREHTQELASMAQASARQSLQNSTDGAVRRRDQETGQLPETLAEAARDKLAMILPNDETKQELEKSEERLLYSSTKHKLISQIKERESARLQSHIHRLAWTYSSKNSNHLSLTSSTHHYHQKSQLQQQQQYLQARIQQLHQENDALCRKHLLSKNSLSSPDVPVTRATSLPMALSPVTTLLTCAGDDRDLVMNTGRLTEPPGLTPCLHKHAGGLDNGEGSKRALVCHKLAEMSRLESTLCDQNQELLRLEKAYSQLHHRYSPSPSLVLASILNNSH